jgi:WhiB family transcriptional regulator, redox-sensing transcriptional regulator
MGEVLLLIDGTDEEAEWTERALCAETDPEAFFPEKGGSTREAKKVCLSCDVRNECLDYALAHDERFGIWGGLSERERRRLKKSAVWSTAAWAGLPAEGEPGGAQGGLRVGWAPISPGNPPASRCAPVKRREPAATTCTPPHP